MEHSHIDWQQLLERAMKARSHAHAPYSQFAVGAAIMTTSGTIYVGCNVENASYGATNCAERTALFSAIAAGEKAGSFVALVVVADTNTPISPCGLCRQVLVELCSPSMPVLMANVHGQQKRTDVSALVPFAFDNSTLFSRRYGDADE